MSPSIGSAEPVQHIPHPCTKSAECRMFDLGACSLAISIVPCDQAVGRRGDVEGDVVPPRFTPLTWHPLFGSHLMIE